MSGSFMYEYRPNSYILQRGAANSRYTIAKAGKVGTDNDKENMNFFVEISQISSDEATTTLNSAALVRHSTHSTKLNVTTAGQEWLSGNIHSMLEFLLIRSSRATGIMEKQKEWINVHILYTTPMKVQLESGIHATINTEGREPRVRVLK